MSIKIVTDSTCDMPPDLIGEHDISVVPMYINTADQSYRDGVDITRQEFYERLPSYPQPPTTAVPGPDTFRKTYEQLAARGATHILSIHISISLSAVSDVARVGAQETSAVPVTVIDSKQLSMGTGFLVETAAEAAEEGRSIGEIITLLQDQIPRTHVFAALDTLEFLCRSGRMSWAMASLGSMLKIKPLLKMYDGVASTEKARTNNGAMIRLIQLVKEIKPVEKLALVHTNAPDRARDLWSRARGLFPHIGHPPSVNVNPVIGSHIGPGVVGFACVAASGQGATA